MRLARQGLKTVYLRHRVTGEDREGNIIDSWDKPVPIKVNVQPAGGSVNTAIYGQDLAYMKMMLYQGDQLTETKNENDGICLAVSSTDDPDYQITSISQYFDHLKVLIKKVDTHAGN